MDMTNLKDQLAPPHAAKKVADGKHSDQASDPEVE